MNFYSPQENSQADKRVKFNYNWSQVLETNIARAN